LAKARYWVITLTGFYLFLWALPNGIDLGLLRFLPLHTAIESISIIIAMLVFGITWHAYAEERPSNLVLIGAVLFSVALIDFVHMLSYFGMPDFVTPPARNNPFLSGWRHAIWLPLACWPLPSAPGSRRIDPSSAIWC
jgi:hypothetical protein